jgi:Fic family protein
MKIDWKAAEDVSLEYKDLHTVDIIDYEKYKLYALVTSSTALEGGTLTDEETILLIDEDITAKGKPFLHHQMVKDNFNAISYAMEMADKKVLLTPELLRKFNSLNMYGTGDIVNCAAGTYNKAVGDFRLNTAFSEALGIYTDPKKIPDYVNTFCGEINKGLLSADTFQKQLQLSFTAHCNLVLIHPWGDGNKRTSRIVMHYIQRYFNLPLTKIDKKHIKAYLQALKEAKDNNSLDKFYSFMVKEHIKTLRDEIKRLKKETDKSFTTMLW